MNAIFIKVPFAESGKSSPVLGKIENTWSPFGKKWALNGTGLLIKNKNILKKIIKQF